METYGNGGGRVMPVDSPVSGTWKGDGAGPRFETIYKMYIREYEARTPGRGPPKGHFRTYHARRTLYTYSESPSVTRYPRHNGCAIANNVAVVMSIGVAVRT